MKQIKGYFRVYGQATVWVAGVAAILAGLMLYRLASLVGGLSANELIAASTPVGWHGIYHDGFYLPLKGLRSLVFALYPAHGEFLTRLPNAIFGMLSVLAFFFLVKLWHGTRSAVLVGLLFATSAWTLHVSRVASFDVIYLWFTATLLLGHALLYKYPTNPFVWYGNIIFWALSLYVPGLAWFVAAEIFLQRKKIAEGWQNFKGWPLRLLAVTISLAWLPLLILNLLKQGSVLMWLGLPNPIASPVALLKQFASVPMHLFIHTPYNPEVWLGQLPLMDIFTLTMCVMGIYFYATKWRAGRSRMLAAFTALGVLLVGLGGPVSLSIIVPLLYVAAATGITYFLHEWLRVFPLNPFARSLGIIFITVLVVLSCIYNLRAYFIAWPHNHSTQAIFHYQR